MAHPSPFSTSTMAIDKLDTPDGGLVGLLLVVDAQRANDTEVGIVRPIQALTMPRARLLISLDIISSWIELAPTRCLLKKIVSTEPKFETDLCSAFTRLLTRELERFMVWHLDE